jgi:hypothetical protein
LWRRGGPGGAAVARVEHGRHLVRRRPAGPDVEQRAGHDAHHPMQKTRAVVAEAHEITLRFECNRVQRANGAPAIGPHAAEGRKIAFADEVGRRGSHPLDVERAIVVIRESPPQGRRMATIEDEIAIVSREGGVARRKRCVDTSRVARRQIAASERDIEDFVKLHTELKSPQEIERFNADFLAMKPAPGSDVLSAIASFSTGKLACDTNEMTCPEA